MTAQDLREIDSAQQALSRLTRAVPDFPQPGILFEDLTPVLADPQAFKLIVQDLAQKCAPYDVDLIGGLDARGFLLGSAVAYELGVGVLAIRKGGKLPPPVYRAEYDLEYGSAALEIPAEEALSLVGKKVFLIDDVLATGGTLEAACSVLEQAKAQVCGLATLKEVPGLEARKRFGELPVYVVATADKEA